MVDNFKPDYTMTSQVYQVMVSDLLINVLDKLDNMGKLSRFISQEIRQLTGARIVILMQYGHSVGDENHILININPKRRSKLADSAEISRLVDLSQNLAEPVLWTQDQCGEADEILARLKIGSAISSPLKIGNETLGCLLVLDLPEDTHGISETLQTLGKLSPILALVIHNAILFERQEDIIAARTIELMKINKDLKSEIKERKGVEESLRKLHGELELRVKDRTKALEIANAELSQYAHVVSHDLKAPLRAVRNYSDFLREDLEDALGGEQKEYLDGLNLAVGQGEQLVNDLLIVSRIGSAGAVSGDIDMGAFFLELAGGLNLPNNVELSLSDGLPVVKADKTLLNQVFQNIIENAVKFNTSPVKRIRIGRSDTGGEGVEFSVHDNGIGIESRFFDKIFLMFQRLHTRQEYEGTGIGLAIVKKALDKLGGSIRVESEPGRGSTFFVSIPEK